MSLLNRLPFKQRTSIRVTSVLHLAKTRLNEPFVTSKVSNAAMKCKPKATFLLTYLRAINQSE